MLNKILYNMYMQKISIDILHKLILYNTKYKSIIVIVIYVSGYHMYF